MNCRDFEGRLEQAGERREAPDAAMLAHAAECPACDRRRRADEALRRGLAALRRQADAAEVPASFAQQARRAAQARRAEAASSRFTWPVAAGVALAAAVFAAAVLSIVPIAPAPPSPVASQRPQAAPAPATDTLAAPVVYSNGGVDIVGAQPAQPESQRVAVLVEWNL